jgi:hypothetical protein
LIAKRYINEAKSNWNTNGKEPENIIQKSKESVIRRNIVEICPNMKISIEEEVFKEIMKFELKNKVELFEEEESVIKLRVIWALYSEGDLEDAKRNKRLNRAHMKAMEILRDIERYANEEDRVKLRRRRIIC